MTMFIEIILSQFIDITPLVSTFNCNFVTITVTIIILGSSCFAGSFPWSHTVPISLLATVGNCVLAGEEIRDQESLCRL